MCVFGFIGGESGDELAGDEDEDEDVVGEWLVVLWCDGEEKWRSKRLTILRTFDWG